MSPSTPERGHRTLKERPKRVTGPALRQFAKDNGLNPDKLTSAEKTDLLLYWDVSPARKADEDWKIEKNNTDIELEEMRGFRGW